MSAQKIGVVSLPSIVPLLKKHGYVVVTGDDFRTAAAQVRLALQTSGPFPVVVGDGPDTHVSAGAWLRSVSASTSVALVVLDGGSGLSSESTKSAHAAPVGLGEVLMETGSGFPPDALFAATVNPDGSLAHGQDSSAADGAPTLAPDQDEDPWASSSVIPGVAVPAQAHLQPAQAAALAAEQEEDPWVSSSSIPGVEVSEPDETRQPSLEPATPEPAPEPALTPAATPIEEDGEDDEEEFDFDDGGALEPAPPQPAPPAPTPAEQNQAPAPAQVYVPAPAPEPAPAEVHEPAPAPAPVPAPFDDSALSDLDDMLASSAERHVTHNRSDATRRGDVVISMSGKGGTGKSASALNLAQYAAQRGPEGFRVVVVDANRGQGDLRTYLRIPTAPIPTIYDAVRTGEASVTVSTPETLAQYRDERWGSLGFALVPAPPADLANPAVVTASVYREVLDYARTVADLVVVDTQIYEAYDTSQLWDQVMIPALAQGAWCLAISDNSTPGVRNLVERLTAFEHLGVRRDRVMLTLNKVPRWDMEAAEVLAQRLATVGRYVGTIAFDERIETEMKVGRLPFDNDYLAPILASTLHTITGLAEFDPARLVVPEPTGLARLLRRWSK